jgi:hypothetical protein
MGCGIYTQDQLDVHRRYDTNLASRQPTMTDLASAAADNVVGGRLGSYLPNGHGPDQQRHDAIMVPDFVHIR